MTKGTKQFSKAMTAMVESPDKRGQGKLFLVQNPQFSAFKGSTKARMNISDVTVEGSPLGTDTGKYKHLAFSVSVCCTSLKCVHRP